MPLFTATITITEVIEAEDIERAKRMAERWKEDLAGSNDGSEAIANSQLDVSQY